MVAKVPPLTACLKIGLSIKEKQAARACSFIFRQALIGKQTILSHFFNDKKAIFIYLIIY